MPPSSTPTLPKDKFYEVKPGFYMDRKDSDYLLDVPLFRYVSLETLYALLQNKIIVSRKNEFSDKHEQGCNYNPFGFQLSCVGYPVTDEDKELWKSIIRMRERTALWYTLCFTFDADDDYLFWKCYTPNGKGARFQTSLRQIINSIEIDSDYEIFIGTITYGDESYSWNLYNYAFRKIIAYKRETELRIYFIPKIATENDSKTITIKTNTDKMIENVLLSPFLTIPQKICIRDIISMMSPTLINRISLSKIIEM